MDCPQCGLEMITAQATNFGAAYYYCRSCKQELDEMKTPVAAYPKCSTGFWVQGVAQDLINLAEVTTGEWEVYDSSWIPPGHIHYWEPSSYGLDMEQCKCHTYRVRKAALRGVTVTGQCVHPPNRRSVSADGTTTYCADCGEYAP